MLTNQLANKINSHNRARLTNTINIQQIKNDYLSCCDYSNNIILKVLTQSNLSVNNNSSAIS